MDNETREKAKYALKAARKMEQLTRELRGRVPKGKSFRARFHLDDAVEHAKQLTRALRWADEILSQRELFDQEESA